MGTPPPPPPWRRNGTKLCSRATLSVKNRRNFISCGGKPRLGYPPPPLLWSEMT